MKNPHKINKTVSAKPESFPDNVELAPLTRRLEHVAKKRGFQTYDEYNKHYLSRQGLASESEHQQRLADKLGLDTPTDYINKLKFIRAKNPKYAEFANLLKTRLSELGMRKIDLARRAGIGRGIVSAYAQGFNYPKPKRLVKILEALQIYHHSPLIGDSHVLGKHVVLQKPKNPKYSELSNLIENALAYSGKDRKWLAKTTKIPQGHITYYMTGRVYPSPRRLQRIKNALYSLTLKK
ncbi:MAG: helix-turn-helix transcriptional regulator [Bacteroidota bacterium]